MMCTKEYSHSFQLLLAQCTFIDKKDVKEVYNWCKEHNIYAMFVGSNYDKDVWFVKDENNRVMFMLRWS